MILNLVPRRFGTFGFATVRVVSSSAMLERTGDLWTLDADARCITTNGITRPSDGAAVMGKGCALEAHHRFPGVANYLGLMLHDYGNHVHQLCQVPKRPMGSGTWMLLSFPTKNHWRDKSDLDLIRQSCVELMEIADTEPTWKTILLPRPGCGAGHLDWDIEVRPAIFDLLDDRVVVVAR